MSRTLNFTSPTRARSALASLLAAAAAVLACGPVRAWEPTKAVEFIVPAGTGGGADPMARCIPGVVAKKGLMKQPIVVVNKGGGQVATQLVGTHVDATVNNPLEAESHWRAGKLRALCVFDAQPLPY
ncbi:MAG: hypothetical protein ACK5V2_09155, partial [Pseudomonadota bacterium]